MHHMYTLGSMDISNGILKKINAQIVALLVNLYMNEVVRLLKWGIVQYPHIFFSVTCFLCEC
jgi:recombinational DNA repair protein (RecF pathway)